MTGRNMHIGDIVVSDAAGSRVALGDVIAGPTIVVLVRYFG
ncbi:MAG: hypothetical protein V3S38_03330 [Acidimicrobiia bacterium]